MKSVHRPLRLGQGGRHAVNDLPEEGYTEICEVEIVPLNLSPRESGTPCGFFSHGGAKQEELGLGGIKLGARGLLVEPDLIQQGRRFVRRPEDNRNVVRERNGGETEDGTEDLAEGAEKRFEAEVVEQRG